MTQVVKYTMKVKVIKYFLQIFVIWNNGPGKKWGARYTFWYIVLLTLCNGDRRIVHWTKVTPFNSHQHQMESWWVSANGRQCIGGLIRYQSFQLFCHVQFIGNLFTKWLYHLISISLASLYQNRFNIELCHFEFYTSSAWCCKVRIRKKMFSKFLPWIFVVGLVFAVAFALVFVFRTYLESWNRDWILVTLTSVFWPPLRLPGVLSVSRETVQVQVFN